MTSKQFRAALRKLELQPQDASSLLGIGLRTVYNYLSDGAHVTNVPTAIVMTLLVHKKITLNDIVETEQSDFTCTQAQEEAMYRAYGNMKSMTIARSR